MSFIKGGNAEGENIYPFKPFEKQIADALAEDELCAFLLAAVSCVFI